MTVTVYSKPRCQQCSATYRRLNALGVEYDVVDVEADPEALKLIKGLGYKQAPVVVTDYAHWGGFNPDQLDELARRVKGA